MLLDNLALFLRIVEKGGLAAAGREVGLSPATVSERLTALERHYGATLLTRTTRAISLTDEGRTLVAGARRLLAEADELESRVRLGAQTLSGPVRLSAPADLGQARVVPVVDAFLAEHPGVTVDLHLGDGYVDLVGQGLDFAIRRGQLADSALRSRSLGRSLGRSRRVVCAAPAYLAAHGTPRHPAELAAHDCIVMRFGQELYAEWPFRIDDEPKRVTVRGRRVANDGALVRAWCVAGHGIALKSLLDVDQDLASGALVEILREFSPGEVDLQIVYPGGAVQPRRVRALIERLAQALVVG
ncbi:LysR family transcriptional regulator [Burkholderia sp. USMB20]|uniref:LysR family transcriptional regulator n=1 Tax=Burkholderia sp. USMB20 TaxID=1571773 RepID=UPI0005CEED92|nr:LysR family transcriptional regulator [Burkholderia sp. USMB20]TGN98952.1 LysR family transcriptional regulator [Burkholderia sp. USMB20]